MTARAGLEEKLLEALGDLEIIDAHEHLPPEPVRLAQEADVFTLFSHYTRYDLLRAGMSPEAYQRLFRVEIPLETRWAGFAPFWALIRHTSYARAARLAAARFYGAGAADIGENNYREISEAIRAANRPGLYRRVLREACRIRTCLTNFDGAETGDELLTPVLPAARFYQVTSRRDLEAPFFAPGERFRDLDAYLGAVRAHIGRLARAGVKGLKLVAGAYGEPDYGAARDLFARLASGTLEIPVDAQTGRAAPNPLNGFLFDEIIRLAGELDLPAAVHTGYWGDFRQLDPLHLIPFLKRHPGVRFDIYHLGYPWVRETLMLGKGFSNAWLNFCWLPIISQHCAAAALDEALDLLPANKIIGFGGDYCRPVEKVYGHLVIARENIARVLAGRIRAGLMDEPEALALARRWLWDNPRELYRLKA